MKIAEVEDICQDEISLIAAVGDGILKRHGVAARILPLSQNSVNVEMISAGASDVTTYFIVNSENEKGFEGYTGILK